MAGRLGWSALCVCAGGWVLSGCVGAVGGDGEEDLGSRSDANAAANAARPDDPPPDCEPVPEECDNGVDDDCDGHIDDNDRDCWDPPEDPPEDPPCQPSPEICNGRDDDCDGVTDEDVCEDVPCEELEGHNCNADPGYGDHCAPADNTGGCSQDRFWAWCNRRNPTYGCVEDAPPLQCIWDSYLYNWVDERCDGEVTLEDQDDDGYWTYTCTDSNGDRWLCTTPLVLAFDPTAPVTYHEGDGRTFFDLTADDRALRTDWPTAVTPWLALDRDGDGLISSGSELFGSATLTLTGMVRNGFEALGDLDANGDGVIDAADPGYALLVSWADENGDRISQPHELTSVAGLGLISIDLGAWRAPRCNFRGNCEIERAAFSYRGASGDVREGAVVDVYLRGR